MTQLRDYFDGLNDERLRVLRALHQHIDHVIKVGSDNVNSLRVLQALRRDVLGLEPRERNEALHCDRR